MDYINISGPLFQQAATFMLSKNKIRPHVNSCERLQIRLSLAAKLNICSASLTACALPGIHSQRLHESASHLKGAMRLAHLAATQGQRENVTLPSRFRACGRHPRNCDPAEQIGRTRSGPPSTSGPAVQRRHTPSPRTAHRWTGAGTAWYSCCQQDRTG